MSRVSVISSSLSDLPKEAIQLIANGNYSLFLVTVEGNLNIRYVLRMGRELIYFLTESGEPLDFCELDFRPACKVGISDCPPLFGPFNITEAMSDL